MISFISWVSDPEQYAGLVQSCARYSFDAEYIAVRDQGISMAQAYNKGTKRAVGDIFVYVHQDTRIHDPLFQKKLEILFRTQENIGFAGPIGNIQKNNGSWWTVGPQFCRGRVHQGAYGQILSFGEYDGPAKQLDSLILCTNKLFEFPEGLPGIHFLDLWMCNEAEKRGYQNWIFNSEIEHISGGETASESYRKNWEIYRQYWWL